MNSQQFSEWGSGSYGMEAASVHVCRREAVAGQSGRLGTRAGLHFTGNGTVAGLARHTPAAGPRRSSPLAGWPEGCVMTSRTRASRGSARGGRFLKKTALFN